jgi:hypothetical protein
MNTRVKDYNETIRSSLIPEADGSVRESGGGIGGWFKELNPATRAKRVWEWGKQWFVSLAKLLFRVVLLFWLVSIVIAGMILFLLARFLRIRSGGLILFIIVTASLWVWSFQVLEPYTGYIFPGLLAFVFSVGMAVNWNALQMNRKVWTYHPTYYNLMCDLANENLKRISRSSVREAISKHIGEETAAPKEQLIDAIENRLVDERLLLPLADGGYQPAYSKRLGLVHLLIAGATIAYLMNGGFGVIEFIPDALPLIGNLDEAGLAVLVFGWLYKLYLLDKAEEEGTHGLEGTAGLGPVPAFVGLSAGTPIAPRVTAESDVKMLGKE